MHNEGDPIAPELMPVLFQPMQRGVKAQGDRSVGLGLFIAQDIVRAHGGSIDVISRASYGTTFSVHLPGGTERQITPRPAGGEHDKRSAWR